MGNGETVMAYDLIFSALPENRIIIRITLIPYQERYLYMIRKTSDRLYRHGYDDDMFIATYESDREIGYSDAGDLMKEMYSSDETVWVSYDIRGKKIYVSYGKLH